MSDTNGLRSMSSSNGIGLEVVDSTGRLVNFFNTYTNTIRNLQDGSLRFDLQNPAIASEVETEIIVSYFQVAIFRDMTAVGIGDAVEHGFSADAELYIFKVNVDLDTIEFQENGYQWSNSGEDTSAIFAAKKWINVRVISEVESID